MWRVSRSKSAEADGLAYMSVPASHRIKFSIIDSLERPNGEIKHRAEVVGIFPNQDGRRLIGTILLERNDGWAVQRTRPMSLESIAPIGDIPLVSPLTLAA
ncbi:hypothetical protein VQ03_18050 [Methylobacterium tarhaniae]|uniref:Transposase n=1 Tax=Methylobacterium tarhaniae TaxID=1187852 RepID=A0A0J6VG97_9HYPH|nr:hypothetical protein VQ03_18050 [Methylobacterium tarhaniae]